MLPTFLGTSVVSYIVLRGTCSGPIGPRLFLSLTFGLIGAGMFSLVMLLR